MPICKWRLSLGEPDVDGDLKTLHRDLRIHERYRRLIPAILDIGWPFLEEFEDGEDMVVSSEISGLDLLSGPPSVLILNDVNFNNFKPISFTVTSEIMVLAQCTASRRSHQN